jgi:hypothetical protein
MKKVMVFVTVLTMVAFVFGCMAVAQKTTTTPARPALAPEVMTFATDDKTKITLEEEVNTFGDLEVGSQVDVAYNKVADKNIAVTVEIVEGTRKGTRPVSNPTVSTDNSTHRSFSGEIVKIDREAKTFNVKGE